MASFIGFVPADHPRLLCAITLDEPMGDHTGGNLQLKEATGCTIIGPKAEAERIPGIDREVSEGDVITFGGFEIRVLDTPGHTVGHVTYWIPAARVAFTGDTLFAMGAGRIFEGNAEMMWRSLKKLMQLPRDTEIYCGHEYTEKNLQFALTLEPNNKKLAEKTQSVRSLRAKGISTVPSTMAEERETNPFLRWDSREMQENLKRMFPNLGLDPVSVFAKVRELKDQF